MVGLRKIGNRDKEVLGSAGRDELQKRLSETKTLSDRIKKVARLRDWSSLVESSLDRLANRILKLQESGVNVQIGNGNVVIRRDTFGNRLVLDPDGRLVVLNSQGQAVGQAGVKEFARRQGIKFSKKRGKIFLKVPRSLG